jgi:D-alanyl-D-alanine carboxypeptidase
MNSYAVAPKKNAGNLNKIFCNILSKSVQKYHLPGAVLAVRDPRGSVYFCHAGYADLKTKQPMARNLYFQIGSLTKTFTATAILMLMDQGRVGLEDQVDDYFPDLLPKNNQITIRNLLQMRSGLAHYENNPEMKTKMLGDPHYQFKPSQLVTYADKILFKPDTRTDYNNVNYIILGMLIEKLTGRVYHQAISDMILKPLKLKNTIVPPPEATPKMPEPFAHGYLVEKEAVIDYSTFFTRSWAWSAGNMISTVDDILKWVEYLTEGALLKPETFRKRMIFFPTVPGKPDYGMGITHKKGAVGHSGNYNFIYTAGAYHYKGYYISALANGQTVDGGSKSVARNIIVEVMDVIDELQLGTH